MATIETKFGIGDIVYDASTTTENKQHPCPDCNGARKWKAISPAGHEYDFQCPRCSASYSGNKDLSLSYSAATPSVKRLTIGSVSHNTNSNHYVAGQWAQGPETRYMCRETGVGSGSTYGEGDLFLTEEEAATVAQLKAAEINATTEWIVKQYDRALTISDYELGNAQVKLAKDADLRARGLLYNINDMIEAIKEVVKEATNEDAIVECIDDYLQYGWQRDKEKLAESPVES